MSHMYPVLCEKWVLNETKLPLARRRFESHGNFFHFTPFVNRIYLRGDPLELTNKHSLDTKHAKTVIVSTYTQFRVILTKVSLKLF